MSNQGVTMTGNQVLIMAAVISLTIIAVFVPNPTLQAVSVGAIAGVVGGHANGSMQAKLQAVAQT